MKQRMTKKGSQLQEACVRISKPCYSRKGKQKQKSNRLFCTWYYEQLAKCVRQAAYVHLFFLFSCRRWTQTIISLSHHKILPERSHAREHTQKTKKETYQWQKSIRSDNSFIYQFIVRPTLAPMIHSHCPHGFSQRFKSIYEIECSLTFFDTKACKMTN